MHSCISDVADFRTACGLPIESGPNVGPSWDRVELMRDLITEEALETRDALNELGNWGERSLDEDELALAEVADGLADLIYVAVGAALELGQGRGAEGCKREANEAGRVDAAGCHGRGVWESVTV